MSLSLHCASFCVLAKDGVSVGCLFLFSACLNFLFAFVYDNHIDIGRKVLSSFHSANGMMSDTAVLGNDKCLI